MIQIDEQKLRQLFKNRSNCYADAENVTQAMDEDCFIETVNEVLRIHNIVSRSEQLLAFAEFVDKDLIDNVPPKEIVERFLSQ